MYACLLHQPSWGFYCSMHKRLPKCEIRKMLNSSNFSREILSSLSGVEMAVWLSELVRLAAKCAKYCQV